MLTRFSPTLFGSRFRLLLFFWMFEAATSSNARLIHILVHPTGEWSARLLIVTLMVTPLALKFKGSAILRWFRKNRRYFGVAAVLTLVHWASLHDWGHPAVAIIHFAPPTLLEGWRLRRWQTLRKATVAA